MSDVLVRRIFKAQIDAWAVAQTPTLPVGHENVTFQPTNARYALAYVLPNDTRSPDLARDMRVYRGIFQVTLFMPTGGGPGEADVLAQTLGTFLPDAAVFTLAGLRLQITSPVSRRPGRSEASRYVVPCDCTYYATPT